MLQNKKKIWWGAATVLFLCILVGGWYYWSSSHNQTMNYSTGQVTRGSIETKINATGTINPVNYVDVSTNIPGELERVLVHENQKVEKGDVIAYIDASQLRDIAAQEEAQVANKKMRYERSRTLYEKGAISAQAYDDDRTAYLTASASYAKAMKNLEQATILAPISGTIIGNPLQPGQTISTGLSNQMIIATIADLSSLEIYIAVDETDIAKVQEGAPVTFTVDAYTDKKFHGTVKEISKGKRGNLGTVSNVVVFYTVKVAIDPREVHELLPTMTARATILGAKKDNVLLVPLTAIRSDKNGEFVYIMIDGQPTRRKVTTGLSSDSSVEIVSGLEEGDTIVVSGNIDGKGDPSAKSRRVR